MRLKNNNLEQKSVFKLLMTKFVFETINATADNDYGSTTSFAMYQKQYILNMSAKIYVSLYLLYSFDFW